MFSTYTEKFCGQVIETEKLDEIIEIVNTFQNLSRTELASTICELFSWKRPTGKLKTVECRQFLERLDLKGIICLPECREKYIKKSKKLFNMHNFNDKQKQTVISVKLQFLTPILLIRVKTQDQRKLWCEYIDRYHYLGFNIPFGAHLRYFIKSGATEDILGCFQFSSPAWKMAARDRWIGWNDTQRKKNLQKIINNSRFLIFPWIKVKNMASYVLSLASRIVPEEWNTCYGYRPVLMETLVDQKQYKGTCYKASNWILCGQTTGRGRNDKEHNYHGMSVKDIYVYPLMSSFRKELINNSLS